MSDDILTGVSNPTVKKLRALKDAKGRAETGWMLIEGKKLIAEALACGLAPRVMLCPPGLRGGALAVRFEGAGGAVYAATENVISAVCDTKTPQGLCAAFDAPALLPLRALPSRVVALDGVQDPGNVGTIWRTADAAGFEALLLGRGCADPLSPKVQRASMGSGLRLPCATCDDLAAALADLRSRGYAVIVSHLRGNPFYEHLPLPEKYALVVGSEARGVSAEVEKTATMRLKLPMRGGAESLNAAIAAGVMMYELTRDLGFAASHDHFCGTDKDAKASDVM